MVHYGHSNQMPTNTEEDTQKNLEDHSVLEFFKSITFKDAIALASIAAFVFGLGVFWNKNYGESSQGLKLAVRKLESDVNARDEQILKLDEQENTATNAKPVSYTHLTLPTTPYV